MGSRAGGAEAQPDPARICWLGFFLPVWLALALRDRSQAERQDSFLSRLEDLVRVAAPAGLLVFAPIFCGPLVTRFPPSQRRINVPSLMLVGLGMAFAPWGPMHSWGGIGARGFPSARTINGIGKGPRDLSVTRSTPEVSSR